MALTVNWSPYNTVDNQVYGANRQNRTDRKTFFAGDSNLVNDPIAQKRKEAREKAWKIISDAWEQDKAVDADIAERKEIYNTNKKQLEKASSELAAIENEKNALQEYYEVDPESDEQKDLELMERYQDQKKGLLSEEVLSKEEEERAEALMEQPLTDYQARALELNDIEGDWELRYRDSKKIMDNMTDDIKNIELELLQSNPMRDAKASADAVMEAASKDIIGTIIQDTKENVDEMMEETEKKTEEAADKKEEKEEELEEIRVERAIQRAIIEGTREAALEAKEEAEKSDVPDVEIGDIAMVTKQGAHMEDAKKNLNDLKYEMKLLEADLKGIKIDDGL